MILFYIVLLLAFLTICFTSIEREFTLWTLHNSKWTHTEAVERSEKLTKNVICCGWQNSKKFLPWFVTFFDSSHGDCDNTQLRAGTVSNDPTLTGLDYSIHTWAPGFSGSCFNVIPFHFVLKISHCLRISSVSTAINRNLKCSFM